MNKFLKTLAVSGTLLSGLLMITSSANAAGLFHCSANWKIINLDSQVLKQEEQLKQCPRSSCGVDILKGSVVGISIYSDSSTTAKIKMEEEINRLIDGIASRHSRKLGTPANPSAEFKSFEVSNIQCSNFEFYKLTRADVDNAFNMETQAAYVAFDSAHQYVTEVWHFPEFKRKNYLCAIASRCNENAELKGRCSYVRAVDAKERPYGPSFPIPDLNSCK